MKLIISLFLMIITLLSLGAVIIYISFEDENEEN